ncbi:MAG: acyl carrier protein [Burkholderiaceae bacterium]|nr:acyl carrier protein [Burkholderiaceae bacterium]
MVSQGQSTTDPAARQPPAARRGDEDLTLQERVRRIVAEQLGVAASRVVPSAKLVMDLGADSLDVVELAMALEEAFGVEIGDDDCENVVTVGDAIDLIVRRSKAVPRAARGGR